MKYTVEIQEILVKTVEVEASTAADAEDKIRARYKSGDITLDADDFFSSSVNATTTANR